MAQELLYLPNVRVALQEMSSTGVPQRVRRDVLLYPGAGRCLPYDPHDVVVVERTAGACRDKEPDLASVAGEEGTGFFQIQLQCNDRALSQRHYPSRVALAVFYAKRG